MNKELAIQQKKNVQKVIKYFDAYLIQNCDKFENFTGRDIDSFYNEKPKLSIKGSKNIIIRNKDSEHYRIFINKSNKTDFLSLDIDEISTIPKFYRNIFKRKFNKKYFCNNTNLYHLDKKSIIFYKLYKYFFVTINSFRQLQILKKEVNNLKKDELNIIKNSILELSFKEEVVIIKKFLDLDIKKFIKNPEVKKFFSKKIFERNKRRYIFRGKLNFFKVFFQKKFFYSFFFGSYAKWTKKHNPMPAIAIVGNDGSGKTTVAEHIRRQFSKMDPLIFDMKFSNPYLLLNFNLVQLLKKKYEYFFDKKNNFFKKFLAVSIELIILFDKYIKYKIGMAWADSGMGLTIFERYPTDRVRGEFPNKKNKLLPFEQFFPLPDGIIYLDVTPKNSIKRKIDDNHTLKEMRSKRKNYISLLNEFDEVEFINHSSNLMTKIKKVKNYIFKISLKKKQQIIKSGKIKRLKWKKNYKRVLAGKNLDRKQKNSYLW